MRIAVAGALIVALMTAGATAQEAAEESWYPSRYGAEDSIGALNNLSPQATRQAADLVRTGQVYALGVVTNRESPAYAPRWYNIIITQSNDGTGPVIGENLATANDDVLVTYLGIGTQIDGFGHLGINHRYYNGARAQDFVTPNGITRFGTESIPPIATRGVLLDMTRGRNGAVPAGTAFNRAEIEAAARAARVTIRRGDVVLFHTGYMDAVMESDPVNYIAQQPGLGVGGAEYLAGLGVVAVGADTAALEAIPFENPNRPYEVHQTLLAKHGVHVLENINTADLARDGATTFLFVLGTPRFEGAVQMVVNPIAIR